GPDPPPSNEDRPGDDDDGEDPEPSQPEPSQPEDEEPECTSGIQAIYETVSCTVTAPKTETADAECTTETVTTTVPCDEPTESTTTTTTTESPQQTRLCSPSRCGGGSCSVAAKRDGLNKREAQERDRQPDACKWAGEYKSWSFAWPNDVSAFD
ncbi:hypothetical protein IMZ48_49690, partial [Candidatus Bathyarchaeota archaeon]|nr:hypothetical protein [Candidatus Bathyarchaeota archaeon]